MTLGTSAWVFSCKFATYFQNTFSYEHLWTAASDMRKSTILRLVLVQYEAETFTSNARGAMMVDSIMSCGRVSRR